MPVRVELRTPNFVQALVLTRPEAHGRSEPHQLASQSCASSEGDTRVDHGWIKIAGLLDESRRSPISRHHDHRFYRDAALFELGDRLIHIHCIALVIKTQNCALIAPLQ